MTTLPAAARHHPRRDRQLRRLSNPRAGEVALRKLQQNLDWWLPGRDRADPPLAALMSAALSFQLDMPWQAAALLVMLRINAVPSQANPVFAAVDFLLDKQHASFVLEALCLSESLEVASAGGACWLEWSYGHATPLAQQLGGWERLREHAARLPAADYRDLVEHAQLWRGRGQLPLHCSLSYLCSDQLTWAEAELKHCLAQEDGFPSCGWRLLATLSNPEPVEALLRRYGQHCPEEWMWTLLAGLGRQAATSFEILRERWGHRSQRKLLAAISCLDGL